MLVHILIMLGIITETDQQYQVRLNVLSSEYQEDIQNGTNIIALQEAPREPIAEDLFQSLQLRSSWKYEVRNTGNIYEQALMFIYDESAIG